MKTKLFLHNNRLVDEEFRNLYNQAKVRGIIGPQGPVGPAGGNGIDGLPGTLNIFRKFLVTIGYYWVGLEPVATPWFWDDNTLSFTEQNLNIYQDYLEKDYFVVSSDQGFMGVVPIFETTKAVVIERIYLHLMERFCYNQPHNNNSYLSPIPFGDRNHGFFLYLARPPYDNLSYGNYDVGNAVAYSGEWDPYLLYPNYPDFVPGPNDPLYTKMTPRAIDNTYYADLTKQQITVLSARGSQPVWRDPRKYPGSVSPGWGLSWGENWYPNGVRLNFDLGFNTFYFCPGYNGPDTILPVEHFPLGGGCIMITMVYREFD